MAVLAVCAIINARAYTEVPGFDGPTWYDGRASSFASGNGYYDNPYVITTAAELALLAYQVNEGGYEYFSRYFVLGADIDLSQKVKVDGQSQTLNWVPIGGNSYHFEGVFLGNEKQFVIKGMTIRANSTEYTGNFGLFGELWGEVDNLKMTDANIEVSCQNANVGIICGSFGDPNKAFRNYTTQGLNLTNCWAEGTLTVDMCSVGGITGYAERYEAFRGCVAKTTINVSNRGDAGGIVGIVGKQNSEITDCHAVVNITSASNSYAGGLFGNSSSSSISKCTASGSITDDGTGIISGMIGRFLKGKMSYCTTTVALSGAKYIGGYMGEAYGQESGRELNSLFCSSFIDARQSTYAGGMVGCLNRVSSSTTPLLETCVFAGTIRTPEETPSNSGYGIVLGGTYRCSGISVNDLIHPNSNWYASYDKNACNLPAYQNENTERLVAKSIYDLTETDELLGLSYRLPLLNMDENTVFKDNFQLAALPFIITNDDTNFFNTYDVTTTFNIGDIISPLTQKAVAQKELPEQTSFLSITPTKAIPLDPGETVAQISYKGLTRKVYLKCVYGKAWNDNEPYNFEYGDGKTAETPYLIRYAKQLEHALQVGKLNNRYFKLANDIFFNNHLLQEDETPKDGARAWTPIDFIGHLDGNGKTLYGLYVNNDNSDAGSAHGLIGTLKGEVSNLAIVDASVSAHEQSNNPSVAAGILCGRTQGAANIRNCMVHGKVLSNGKSGGMVGFAKYEDNMGASFTDCFSCVHIGWPSGSSINNYYGCGLACGKPAEVVRCIATGKVEDYLGFSYGLIEDAENITNSFFDRQMMAIDYWGREGRLHTKDLIANENFSNNSTWYIENHRYPILSQFKDTPYGNILSMPVLFDDDDDAGHVTQIFEFPTENVIWSAYHDQQYVDVIMECGAASPNANTNDDTELLIARTTDSNSECTAALRTLAINVRVNGLVGIKFKYPATEEACITAFDANNDGILVLREAFESTNSVFKNNFNRIAGNVEHFPELRYFAGITNIEKGMLSNLPNLKDLQLPKQLSTISNEAFTGCTSLEEITTPVPFTGIKTGAFLGSSIKNIWTEPRCKKVYSRDGVLFSMADDLLAYPQARGENAITLQGPLNNIHTSAIYKIPGLERIYIDNCLPDGNMAVLYPNGIVHEDEDQMVQIYINDGSYALVGDQDHDGGYCGAKLYREYLDDASWEEFVDEDALHLYFPLNITSAGWATMYIDFDVELPKGLSAYIVTPYEQDATTVILKNVGRKLPHSTPIVIKSDEPGLYLLDKSPQLIDKSIINKWENRLIGTEIGNYDKFGTPVNQGTSNEGSVLTLGHNSNGELGFFFYNVTGMIPPYKAYLAVNSVEEAKQGICMIIDDSIDDVLPTGITSQSSSLTSQPAIIYNMMGMPIQGPLQEQPKGIYIINGKKVIKK